MDERETQAPAEREADLAAVGELAEARRTLLGEIEKRIIGQKNVVDHLLVALFARGHCLFVGVPGLAKTLLISTLAEALDLTFNRIQFTPDLMPSDITGTDVLEEDHTTGKRAFRFVHGPIFANLLLADEINRTPPKTQAALAPGHAGVPGHRRRPDLPARPALPRLRDPEPHRAGGDLPAPRGPARPLHVLRGRGLPVGEEEVRIVNATTSSSRPVLRRVLSPARIRQLQELVLRVPAADHVVRYAVELVRRTRPKEPGAPDFVRDYVAWGAGPRASQYLILGAKSRAVLDGRVAASEEDVRALARPVLVHRVIASFRAESDGVSSRDVVDRLLEKVKP